MEKKGLKRMKNLTKNKVKGVFECIRNSRSNSVWINDFPILYYSILDDESICQIFLFMILI